MEKTSSKRIVMGLAAILVLIFHFWIPMTKAALIVKAAFIGVDMFFFVSAWSLGKQKKIEFLPFMKNRLSLVYFPFIVLAITGCIYSHWSFKKFASVISSIDFFKKGGGAFLWYLIAILFVYALTPLLIKIKSRFKWLGLLMMMGFWLVLTTVLQFVFGYTKIFILLNRLPVFFIALYYKDLQSLIASKIRLIIALLLTCSGLYLVYKFGTSIRLNKPFVDFYYIMAIPLVMGVIELIDQVISVTNYKFWILSFIGKITLEIYGLQMIFGYNIEAKLLKVMGKNMSVLVFLITVLIIIGMAFVLNILLKLIRTEVSKVIIHLKGEKK